MGRAWPLHEAKNKFSEVVDRAQHEGPQVVTRRGKEVVVVIAADAYRRLTMPSASLKELLLSAPRADLSIDRDRDPGREIDLG